MNYDQLCSHFGGPSKAADALGIEDRRSVGTWKTRRIPSKWQLKAQAISKGALVADKEAQAEAAEYGDILKLLKKAA